MAYKLNTIEAEFSKDPKINRDDIKELVDWVPTVDNMPKVTGKIIFDGKFENVMFLKFSLAGLLSSKNNFHNNLMMVNILSSSYVKLSVV